MTTAATTSNGMTTSAASASLRTRNPLHASPYRGVCCNLAWLGWRLLRWWGGEVDRLRAQMVLQCCGEFSTAGEPIGRRFGHRPGQHRVQPSQLRAPLLERWRRGHAMFGDHHRGIGIDIWRRSGQQVKSGAGQRVLIGAPVERLTLQLLGRRVGHRAHRHVRLGQPRYVIDAASYSEVGQKNSPRLRIQQDVGRFDIAVQQPPLMRIIQC